MIACGCAGAEPRPSTDIPPIVVPPKPPPAPPAEAPSPFHVAALSGDEGEPFAIHRLGATLLVADPTAGLLLEARGDEVLWEPGLLAGLPRDFWSYAGGPGHTIFDVAGRFPDRAWMVTIPGGDARMAGYRIHRYERDRWVEQPRLLRVPIGRHGWIRSLGARTIATYDEHRLSPNDRPVLQVIDGPPAGTLPRMPCFQPPADLATLPTGEVFLVAQAPLRCRDEKAGPEGPPAVLYAWDKDARDPRVIRLARGFHPEAVVALSPTDVRIAGAIRDEGGELPAVAIFDESGVGTQYLPGRGNPHAMTAEPDGTLWIAGPIYSADDNGLWRKSPYGPWRAVPLPRVPENTGNRVSPWNIVARGPGDVWMSGSAGAMRGLFHTRPPARVLVVPTREERWKVIRALGRKDLPEPPGPH